MPTFSEKLKFLMKEKSLTQSDISKVVGLSDAAITGWMKGAKPRKNALEKLANHFKLSLTSLQDDKREIEFLGFPDFLIASQDYRDEDEIKSCAEIYSEILDTDWVNGPFPKIYLSPQEDIAESIQFAVSECVYKINEQIKVVENASRNHKVITRETLFKIISKCNAANSAIQDFVFLLCLCFEKMEITRIKEIIKEYITKREKFEEESFYKEE